jgi:hypothetical protein
MINRRMFRMIMGALRALALLLTFEQAAHAASGTIVGAAFSRNMNGNYCPSTNTCTGARYLQADYDWWQPISNAYVNVYDTSWNYLGQGVTDDNGQFSVPWAATPKPAQVYIKVFAWHRESRFYFTDTNGAAYGGYTLVTLAAGATTNIYNRYWGTSASPDKYFNAYWAAELQWRRVMNYVGRLQTQFSNVEVRGFANSMPTFLGTCNSSCAAGEQKRVQLDASAALKPQARAMHELGHVAEYVTKPWSRTIDYTQDGVAGWSQDSPEFGHTSFQEAWATHYGSIAFWYPSADTPTTCNTVDHCYTTPSVPPSVPLGSTNIEATSYPYVVNNCSTALGEKRWALSQMRYFWDVYDTHNDCDGDTYTASGADFWRHLSNTYYYPDGNGPNQIHTSGRACW